MCLSRGWISTKAIKRAGCLLLSPLQLPGTRLLRVDLGRLRRQRLRRVRFLLWWRLWQPLLRWHLLWS